MVILSDESNGFNIKVVGAISIPEDKLIEFEKEVLELRYKYHDYDEIKWNELGKDRTTFYWQAIKLFFSYPEAVFHSNSYLDLHKQHQVQYRLVENISWKLNDIGWTKNLRVMIDKQSKLSKNKVQAMETYLKKSRNSSKISMEPKVHQDIDCCKEIESHVLNLMQVTDLLSGCLAYKLNMGKDMRCTKNKFKDGFVRNIEILDNGISLNAKAPKAYGRWDYNDKKIQHYNLHEKTLLSL